MRRSSFVTGIRRLPRTRRAPNLSLITNRSCSANAATSNKDKDLPKEATCVVIGGGVVGAGILYHLAKKGFSDAVLLEKGTLTCGSTWHAAGLCAFYHGGSNLRKVHHYSCELYKTLQAETGVDVGFHTPGSIRLYEDTPDRRDEAYFQMGKSTLFDAPQELITPTQIKELHPLINLEGIWAGIYNPGDGHIDPTGSTNALIKGARNGGCKVFQNSPVEDLNLRTDGRWEVTSNGSQIVADRIINAAGLWGDTVATMAGVHHPLAVIQHQYVITKTIPEVTDFWKEKGHQLPVLRSLEGSYYVRQERDGLLVGPYEPKTDMQMQDDWNQRPFGKISPMEFGHDLFPEDLERIMWNLEHVSNLIPLFGSAEVNSVVNGPVSWPPDGNGLIGPVNDVPNYWAAVGNSYGIAQSAGIADYLTDWIIDGEPPYEMFELDPTRFGPWAGKHFTDKKVRETYGMNNNVVFPNEERLEGRPLRTTPVYSTLKAKGCQFGFHNGLETPLWFADPNDPNHYQPSFRRTNWHDAIGKECATVMRSCGIMDASSFCKFLISGKDATSFMDSIQANKLPAVGKVGIGHMISEKGKIIAELTMARLHESAYYVCSGSDMERHDLRWMQMNNIPAYVDITNLTQSYGVLAVAGPNSTKLLNHCGFGAPGEFENLPYFGVLETEIAGCPVMLLKLSYTGLRPGWEVHCQQEYMYNVYNALKASGEELNIEVGDFGGYALNSFRLEAGFKGLGTDMRKDTPAMACGIKRFVKMKNRSFVGKQALQNEKKNPFSHMIVKMEVDVADADALGDNPIYLDKDSEGKPVGWASSGGFSFVTNRSLAFAWVPPELSAEGTEVWVYILGERRKCKVLGEAL